MNYDLVLSSVDLCCLTILENNKYFNYNEVSQLVCICLHWFADKLADAEFSFSHNCIVTNRNLKRQVYGLKNLTEPSISPLLNWKLCRLILL